MKTDDFDYELPAEMIAQTPVEPRDQSRLLVLERTSGKIHHARFHQLVEFLSPGDRLVVNETRVIPARLYARKLPGGGRVELLLLRREDSTTWEALVGGKGLIAGRRLEVDAGPGAVIESELEGPRRRIRFDEPIEPHLSEAGHMPLPPYIHATPADPERYQTVYARTPGSAAAPTAGLHFTARLIDELERRGIGFTRITLHVGMDTFAPVTEGLAEEHKIHTEWCELDAQAAGEILATKQAGGRVIAVGTTAVRTLESAASNAPPGLTVAAFRGPTDLFILPGYRFKLVDSMITNFHLPRSTLIMLVSAFAGRERTLETYQVAKREKYRFYSFGDAMMIV